VPRKNRPLDIDNVPGAIPAASVAGYAAYKSGLAFRSDNPYKHGTQCRQMWLAGWHAAEIQDGKQ